MKKLGLSILLVVIVALTGIYFFQKAKMDFEPPIMQPSQGDSAGAAGYGEKLATLTLHAKIPPELAPELSKHTQAREFQVMFWRKDRQNIIVPATEVAYAGTQFTLKVTAPESKVAETNTIRIFSSTQPWGYSTQEVPLAEGKKADSPRGLFFYVARKTGGSPSECKSSAANSPSVTLELIPSSDMKSTLGPNQKFLVSLIQARLGITQQKAPQILLGGAEVSGATLLKGQAEVQIRLSQDLGSLAAQDPTGFLIVTFTGCNSETGGCLDQIVNIATNRQNLLVPQNYSMSNSLCSDRKYKFLIVPGNAELSRILPAEIKKLD